MHDICSQNNFNKQVGAFIVSFLSQPDLDFCRTSRVRWGFVFSNLAQVVCAMFYVYYIFERFCIPVFQDFNRAHITPRTIILSSFGCMMPGTLVLFLGMNFRLNVSL